MCCHLFRISYYLYYLIPILIGCFACDDGQSPVTNNKQSNAPTEMEQLSIQNQNDRPLVQPVRWENFDEEEGEEVASHLIDIYTELSDEMMSVTENSESNPQEDCYECGRETGFLPAPSLQVDGFTQLTEKEADFVLLSWDAVPEASSYQLIKVQVSDHFSEINKAVNTDTLELGLSLDYGYAYLLYLFAHDDINKIRSSASNPILLYCDDGCWLLPY